MSKKHSSTPRVDPAQLLGEARRLVDRYGWSVISAIGKKPAIRTWKPFQRRLPCEKELVDGFSDPRVTGLAIVCGTVSGALVVRDFDKADAYHHWRAGHRTLARSLPTCVTSRGFQVYFRSPNVRRIRHFEDGELRGAGYVVGPPSKHPSGHFYEWLVSPSTTIPFLDDRDLRSLAGASDLSGACNMVQPIACVTPPTTVEDAIAATLPTAFGQRNRRVFDFARCIRTLVGPDAVETDLRELVQNWHRRALPTIRTKEFRETWTDFRVAWQRIRFAPLRIEGIRQQIAADEGEPIEKLRLLCQSLQQLWGEQPFFLAARLAGELIGTSAMTANRLMRRLQGTELILVRTGMLAGRQGSLWLYVGRRNS